MAQEDKHSEVNNSAIGSWSGFIYQGLVAVCHALTLLKEDKEKYINYSLCLDAFEDFSVHDENDKIVSLHQCKCYATPQDFTEECNKMIVKRDEYKQSKECAQNVNLYLHTNNPPKNSTSNIQSMVCKQAELLDGIKNKVAEIGAGTIVNSGDVVVCRLIGLVDEFVVCIQGEYHERYEKKSSEKLWIIAKDKRLSFQKVWDCLFDDALFDTQSIGVFIKTQLLLQLEKYAEDCVMIGHPVNSNRYDLLVKTIGELDNAVARDVFHRVHPQYSYEGDLSSISNLISNSTNRPLLRVLFDVSAIPSSLLDWHENEQYESASSIVANDEQDLWNIVIEIMRNSPNNSSLRKYDWFVGKVSQQVDDIHKVVNQFATFQEPKDSIFAEKKIGIMSINDLNHGNY